MQDTITRSIRFQSAVILLLSCVLMAFGFGTMWVRAALSFEGTIIQSDTVCDPFNHARCSTTYVISNAQGTVTYIAGANKESLQGSLPVGTTIRKQRWQLVYEVNGVVVDDFGTGSATAIGGVGLFLCIASCILIANPTIIPLGIRKRLVKLRS